jgi:hypothetical protein
MVVAAAMLLLVAAGIGYAVVQGTSKTPSASRPDGGGSVVTTDGKRAGAAQVPEVLWSADMEDGSLRAWYAPETSAVGDFGGGEFTSGGGETSASDEQAHSGTWSAKLTLATELGGARLFRWREFRAERDLTQRVWMFIPEAYRLTGAASDGRFWDITQLKSQTENLDRNDPIWFVNLTNEDGELVPQLVWWSRTLEGPHRDQSGFRRYTNEEARVPVGKWFELTTRVRQSNEFDGIVEVSVNGEKIFSVDDVRTAYRSCTYDDWCTDQHWSVNNYSDGLSPAPAEIFVDDAVIERATG